MKEIKNVAAERRAGDIQETAAVVTVMAKLATRVIDVRGKV